jgi:very-short-patch-repair endonuclease
MVPHRPPLSEIVKDRCREFRHQPTVAEEKLWAYLKNRQLCGLKFRRQHPFLGYILDFYCKEVNLCIELDGSGHLEHDQVEYDLERTRYLEEQGIHVVRFMNSDVLAHIDLVLDQIMKEINPSS